MIAFSHQDPTTLSAANRASAWRFAGVDSTGRIESFFDAISYQKGGSVIRMLRAFLNNQRVADEQYGLRRSLLQVRKSLTTSRVPLPYPLSSLSPLLLSTTLHAVSWHHFWSRCYLLLLNNQCGADEQYNLRRSLLQVCTTLTKFLFSPFPVLEGRFCDLQATCLYRQPAHSSQADCNLLHPPALLLSYLCLSQQQCQSQVCQEKLGMCSASVGPPDGLLLSNMLGERDA